MCSLCGYYTNNYFQCSLSDHNFVCKNCNRKSFQKAILTAKVSQYFESEHYMIQPSKARKSKNRTAAAVQQEQQQNEQNE
jgi:hypothetical protein